MPDKQQPLPGGFEPDPARYRKAAEPHESRQDAENALKAFYNELSELRVKYRIKDILFTLALLACIVAFVFYVAGKPKPSQSTPPLLPHIESEP